MEVLDNVISNPAAADAVLAAATATNSFFNATVNSLMMILATELGDKTFFIAAILAMKHGRLVVYAGAMGALAVMHLLSSVMGYALPALLPRTYTHFLSAVLFAYFGLKLLKDGYEMEGGQPSEELQEVEEELEAKKAEGNENDDVIDVESGEKKEMHSSGFAAEKIKIFTQAFTLTFLAEWGDRSQIATIALASSKNVFGVIIGGLVGHAFCTGLAVIGGRLLAAKISEKTTTLVGGSLFLFFAVTSFLWGPDMD